MADTILVVDDDQAFRGMLMEALVKRGFTVSEADTAEAGIAMLKKDAFDLVLQDVRLPGMSGIEALEHIQRAAPLTDVIIMTAYGGRGTAVEAMQKGAYDYFTKPFSLAEMEVVIRRALEKRRLQKQVRQLKKRLGQDGPLENIIGQSPPILRVKELIQKVAPLDVGVLVIGETGTGKELVSDTLHILSPRAEAPFVKLNCAAIPENLMESELFGHEKGAFTGASSAKQGKFEQAQGGTILLDEIGDMPLNLQPKLLRAVEQKQVTRLGGSKAVTFDVRIVAATNQDLELRVQDKAFRSDLYYRLNVATIPLPPLRERKEDLPLLAEHFLERINARVGTAITGLSAGALKTLYSLDWPGNVRQLAHALERAAIFCSGSRIHTRDLALAAPRQAAETMTMPDAGLSLKDAVSQYERNLILKALRAADGVQTEAAKALGVSPTNLWNKLKKHAINPDDPIAGA